MRLLVERNEYGSFYPYEEEFNYHDNEILPEDDFVLLERSDGIIGVKSFGKVIHDNTIARLVVEIWESERVKEYYYQVILPGLVATDLYGWGGVYQNIAHTETPLNEVKLEQLLNSKGWYFLDTI